MNIMDLLGGRRPQQGLGMTGMPAQRSPYAGPAIGDDIARSGFEDGAAGPPPARTGWTGALFGPQGPVQPQSESMGWLGRVGGAEGPPAALERPDDASALAGVAAPAMKQGGGVFDRIGAFLGSDEGRAALLRSGAETLRTGNIGAGIAAGAGYIGGLRQDERDQRARMDQWTAQQEFKRQNPEPQQPTEFERMLLESGVQPGTPKWIEAHRARAENMYDPIVTVPFPDGTYAGARSGLSGYISGRNEDGGAPGGNPLPVLNSPSEAGRLPPGTLFRTPDGRTMRVPGGPTRSASGNF